jgi:hypothetical protein
MLFPRYTLFSLCSLTWLCDDQLERSIGGRYVLEAACDTACGALHRRVNEGDIDANEAPLYFFFDPTRSNNPDYDFFVFANESERHDFKTIRPVIARLNENWRPNDDIEAQSVSIFVSSKWSTLEGSTVNREVIDHSSSFALPSQVLTIKTGDAACTYAEALLTARVNTSDAFRAALAKSDEWEQVDLLRQGSEVFEKLSWILARIPALDKSSEWQVVHMTVSPSLQL